MTVCPPWPSVDDLSRMGGQDLAKVATRLGMRVRFNATRDTILKQVTAEIRRRKRAERDERREVRDMGSKTATGKAAPPATGDGRPGEADARLAAVAQVASALESLALAVMDLTKALQEPPEPSPRPMPAERLESYVRGLNPVFLVGRTVADALGDLEGTARAEGFVPPSEAELERALCAAFPLKRGRGGVLVADGDGGAR